MSSSDLKSIIRVMSRFGCRDRGWVPGQELGSGAGSGLGVDHWGRVLVQISGSGPELIIETDFWVRNYFLNKFFLLSSQ